MPQTIRFLNGNPACCGDVSLPSDIIRAGLESSGNVCMESDTEPEFFTRWVHTPADSPDNIAPKDADNPTTMGGIAIVLTDAEYDTVLAASARQKRDRLIAATDYLVTPDYPIEPDRLAKVKIYRQALRDIPEQSGFPRTITWPEKP